MPADLCGIRVMITRPAHQAGHLKTLIEQAGGETLLFPLLEITPPVDDTALDPILDQLAQFDVAVFISPNAVEYGLRRLQQQGIPLPDTLKLATIGKGSAELFLSLSGRKSDLCPEHQFNSEGLLALDALQNIAGMRVIIFRGQSGREKLAQTLRARGADVTYAAVYERNKPDVDNSILQQALLNNSIDIISITSGDALHNLLEMAGEQCRKALHNIQLVVTNTRLVDIARKLGFSKPAIISDTASDEAIVHAIQHWSTETAQHRILRH